MEMALGPGISQEVDMQLVWIVEDIADAEALVAREGSGIGEVANLVGRKVGVLDLLMRKVERALVPCKGRL